MKAIIYIMILFAFTSVSAQHMHHNMPDTTGKKPMHMQHMADSTTHTNHMAMPMHDMGTMMSSQFSRNLLMNRDGSGTSWQPDESPIYAYMIHGKKWMTMIHGDVFMRYNNQDLFKSGSRGGSKFDAPNMLMGMTQRKIGKNGLLAFNGMLSLDPFTVGGDGYPLLYQTGESYKGHKLVDRQHPHDLFAELNVAYTQALSKNTDLYASFGYPGEPALGPPVFMHRLSAMSNPDAPLSHHYADATHITFGVATLGFRVSNVKIEGSVFTGREPDEHRYDFDKPRFDSYSVRLSYNPTKNWALQVSNGWIHCPEDLEPQQNVDRFTASAIHTKMLNDDSFISTTFVYGQNHYSDNGKTLPSALLESNLQWHKTAFYGKYEYVQKDADELDLSHSAAGADPDYNINGLTIGANRILTTYKNTDLRMGLQGTLNFSPTALQPLYGKAPVGFEVYVRVSPALMKMGNHKKHDNMNM
ncbi:hypothetical protein [Mucilaginibacter sp. KACC 22063]|uniref:hypothetical protein n=1 Tax=Mucilaginibacter sp. KACC 22063 TaxID=3025666 RepID=UPI0023667EFB|nr:hypothetical protein [Mucilaginibacter sp. KACC 22063]WDF55372.1 hypothetical protein PQ461_20795 [Mucilaginibacter sp. KACC 22063]